jgi:hypothetical protein
MEINIQVGLTPVRINAQHLPKILETYFSSFPRTDRDPHVEFFFEDDVAQRRDIKTSFTVDSASVCEDALKFTDSVTPFSYVIKISENGMVTIYCDLRDYSRITSFKQRLRYTRMFDPFYFHREERAIRFVHALWHFIMQVVMIDSGNSFVHASCVEKGGKALLLPAWGGGGKTALMHQLIMQDSWKLLADDMAIVSRDGSVFMNLTPIGLYPCDLKGFPLLYRRSMATQSLGGRVHWHLWKRLRGTRKVARRIYHEHLFGKESIAQQGKLEQVIYLLQGNSPEFTLKKMVPEELAQCATNSLLGEIRQFRYELQAWNSIPDSHLFPNIWDIAKQINDILHSAFQTSDSYALMIPMQAQPADMYAFLSQNLFFH